MERRSIKAVDLVSNKIIEQRIMEYRRQTITQLKGYVEERLINESMTIKEAILKLAKKPKLV